MRRTITTTTRRALIALAAGFVLLAGAPHTASADDGHMSLTGSTGLRVIGLTTDGRLVQFSTNAPRRTSDIGYVQGLTGGDTALVGIDFRVQDGNLYGVGNGGGIYTIDTTTAQATFVNALSVPL